MRFLPYLAPTGQPVAVLDLEVNVLLLPEDDYDCLSLDEAWHFVHSQFPSASIGEPLDELPFLQGASHAA